MINNITFIVGNGLDISLGLETKYVDFYTYIQKNNGPAADNQIYKAIAKDPDTWADFEKALGVHTQVIEETLRGKNRVEASKRLHKAFDEVLSDLGDYLQEQVAQSSDRIPLYTMDYKDFYAGLPGELSRMITSSLKIPVNMGFITLNYTDTLERMLINRQTMLRRGIRISQIHHAHGELSQYITMGVSNESQLSAALQGDSRDDLIKPRLLKSMQDGRLSTTMSIIDRSDVIVLFGTSYGATDEYIWQYVIEWLKASEDRLIILHDYNPEYMQKPTRNPSRIKQLDNEARSRLLEHAGVLGDGEEVELRARILVVRNTNKLFKG